MMTAMMRNGLEEGFILDRQWFWLRGEMERTKRPALLALARVFAGAEVPYAIIGGIALQAHQAEPRTTLDIDVAVAAYSLLPHAQLEAAGFTCSGRFSHSENWIGPEGTPVQFTDDPALAEAITRAEEVELEDVRLRVIGRADLLHAKLRAAADPARRRSKRLQDLVDAQALLESTPPLEQELSAEERALLDRLPR
jgi:nucleotidyltransferase AbiEii toxin of type IV toxin-antitoxin system